MNKRSPHHAHSVWTRNFTLLWFGHVVSNLGNSVFLVVMLLLVQRLTGSPAWVAGVQMAAFVPVAVLAVHGGISADRYSRRAMLVLSDSVRGAAMLILAGLLLWQPGLGLAASLTASLIIGIGSAYFSPAVQSLLPDLVPDTALPAANSWRVGASLVTAVAGNMLGGILFVTVGAAVVLAANGVSFLLSAYSESRISAVGNPSAASTGPSAASAGPSAASTGPSAAQKVRLLPAELRLILLHLCFTAIYPALVVVLPFYVSETLQRSEVWLGLLVSTAFLGSIAGFIAASLLPAGSLRIRASSAYGGMAAALTTIAVLPRLLPAGHTYAAAAMLFLIGAAGAFVYTAVLTGLQRSANSSRRGRVFGRLEAAAAAITPLGYAVGGIAMEVGGIQFTLILLSLPAAAAAVYAYFGFRSFTHV